MQQLAAPLFGLTSATAAAWVVQRSGHWDIESYHTRDPTMPKPSSQDLGRFAANLKPHDVVTADNWTMVSLPPGAMLPETSPPISFVSLHVPRAGFEAETIDAALMLLSRVIAICQSQTRTAAVLAAQSIVLAAAARWQSIDDADDLLHSIAATAVEVLHCQRASIFLRDARGSTLIGRPAIGLPSGKLVIPDDRGIVGEVISTGQNQLWTRGDDAGGRHNAAVDKDLNFETQSLAAVPLWEIAAPRTQNSISQDSISTHSNVTQSTARKKAAKPTGVFEAINAKSGAFQADDLQILTELALHASAAIAGQSRRAGLIRTRDQLLGEAKSAAQWIGSHATIETLRRQVAKVAPTDLSILIRGENGTGKEIMAQQIHYQSNRREGPFIAVNCAAIVETLLESELFGHEKGSFTDASQTRIGKFEAAAGGTLFLDEIGDMTGGGQAKLLRALESREIVRVGGTETIAVDVRIVAATNQPLERKIAEKSFREDLFFRLSVVSLTLPPLRDRGDDVIEIANSFLQRFAPHAGRTELQLSPAAVEHLRSYAWPGNIRQLRNVIERACYLSEDTQILPGDLDLPTRTPAVATRTSVEDLSEATQRFQIQHIERSIAAHDGNVTAAAESLGINRSNLYRKMRQLGMTDNH